MLAIESVLDKLDFASIELVEDPVSIFLHSRCENDNLVVGTELFEKLHAIGPDPEEGLLALLR